MQKIALIISVIALALGGYAVLSAPSEDGAKPTRQTMVSNEGESDFRASAENGEGPRIAFVRTDSIYAKCQFILDAEDDLIQTTRISENKFEKEYNKAQQEYMELMQYAQSPQATEEELMIAQQRLMQLEQELQALQQQENERVMRKEQQLQESVNKRLKSFMDRFAEENGIDLILNKGISGEGVIYGSMPFDITNEVVDGLNTEYALEQAQGEGK